MQAIENKRDKTSLSFKEFGIKSLNSFPVKNLNVDLGWNCDVLLYSKNKDASIIPGLFIFDIFNDMKLQGKIIHNGINIIDLITKIKKFRIKGNRLGILARLLDDVFSIPSNPIKLFHPDIKISSQILDFVPYKTRIDALNAIVRREMIKLTEIREIINGFDAVEDKTTYAIIKSKDFGVLQVYNEMYRILNSGSDNRENLLAALIMSEKTGVNLAEVVILRNYYEYRLSYDRINGDIYRSNIEGKHKNKIYKEKRAIKKIGIKEFSFMSFNVVRSYSEKILKDEIITIVKNYMKLIGISYKSETYEVFPEDANIAELYKLLTCLAFIAGNSVMIIDLTDNPFVAGEISEFINRFRSIQNMACLYMSSEEELAGNRNKIFDRVINL